MQAAGILSGDLKFLSTGKKAVDLSRSMVIALDEALSVAQALNQTTIDTDHLLGVMTEREVGTAGILTQFGITKGALREVLTTSATSTTVIRRTDTGASSDMVAAARTGMLRAVYFGRLLREPSDGSDCQPRDPDWPGWGGQAHAGL